MGGVYTQSQLKTPRHDYLDQFTVLFLDAGYEFPLGQIQAGM